MLAFQVACTCIFGVLSRGHRFPEGILRMRRCKGIVGVQVALLKHVLMPIAQPRDGQPGLFNQGLNLLWSSTSICLQSVPPIAVPIR